MKKYSTNEFSVYKIGKRYYNRREITLIIIGIIFVVGVTLNCFYAYATGG